MQSKNSIYNALAFFFLIFLQLFVVRELSLWGVGFCYIYVGILLIIPITFPKSYSLFIAFFLGLFIDIFYNTPGINAFASVLLVFLKPYVFKNIPTQANFEENNLIIPNNFGAVNFIVYALILLFIHHFALFQLQAYSSAFIWGSLVKAVVSTLFTLISTVTVLYLIFSTKTRR